MNTMHKSKVQEGTLSNHVVWPKRLEAEWPWALSAQPVLDGGAPAPERGGLTLPDRGAASELRVAQLLNSRSSCGQ